jgi:hypothetical protein
MIVQKFSRMRRASRALDTVSRPSISNSFRFFFRFEQAVQRLIGGDRYKGGLFDVGGDPFRLFVRLKKQSKKR